MEWSKSEYDLLKAGPVGTLGAHRRVDDHLVELPAHSGGVCADSHLLCLQADAFRGLLFGADPGVGHRDSFVIDFYRKASGSHAQLSVYRVQ
jgi:hypothetical protein